MFQAIHVLAGMAQWCVAHIVKQGCCKQHTPMGGQFRMETSQLLQSLPSQLQDAKRVSEATGFSSMKCEEGRSKLPNSSESLERQGVDQLDGQGFGRLLLAEGDCAV